MLWRQLRQEREVVLAQCVDPVGCREKLCRDRLREMVAQFRAQFFDGVDRILAGSATVCGERAG